MSSSDWRWGDWGLWVRSLPGSDFGRSWRVRPWGCRKLPERRLWLAPDETRPGEKSYHEVVPVKVRELIRTLEDAGWRHIRTSGDHRVFKNQEGRITVVSGKSGDDVRPGTYRAVLRQTGIKEADK